MDSAGMAHGTGSSSARRRPSPAVYRRRRLVAAVLALAVLAGLIFGISAVVGALTGAGPAQGPSEPVAGSEPTATASAPPAPAGECDQTKVIVAAETDAANYGPGEEPVLTLSVRNTGKAPCKVNVGTSQMEFQVTSAEDRVFSSVDCQDGATDLQKVIGPGKEEKATLIWDRVRSAPGCSAVEAKPGPGTYALVTKLGTRTSEKTTFVLK